MPPPDTEQRYGWFSPWAARMLGTVIYYSTPRGGRVAVTLVSHSMTDSGSNWPDIQYVGPVIDFVERVDYHDPNNPYACSMTVGVIRRRDDWPGLSQVYRTHLGAMVETPLKSPAGSC